MKNETALKTKQLNEIRRYGKSRILKTEIMQASENSFIKNYIRTTTRVCEHRLNFFDNVGFVF